MVTRRGGEECIRDAFYALLMDYLIKNNFKVNNVSFSNALPEFHTGSGRADLVLLEYLDSGEVSPFLLLEFEVAEGDLSLRWEFERIISSSYEDKVERLQLIEPFGQLIRYCRSINPSYSGYIEFHKKSASFNIVVMEGCDLTNIVYSKTAGTIDDEIIDDILRTLTSRKAVINKKHKYLIWRFSFEDFIKGELMRGLMKDYVVSTECYTFISGSLSEASQTPKHYGYPDVVIYDIPPRRYPDVKSMCMLGRASNQLPFIVIEVKSNSARFYLHDHNVYLQAYKQAYRYGVSMSSDYFATAIYGRTMLTFNIYDTQSQTLRSSFTIPFTKYGNAFMFKVEMLRDKLGSLPRKVHDCNNVPNGFYDVNKLVQLGVKIVPIPSFNPIKLIKLDPTRFGSYLISTATIGGIYGCSTFSPDDPIVLASECMFPRLALVYEDGKKPSWCEFQNGVLAKCDVDVIAMYLAYPCSTICVAKYISLKGETKLRGPSESPWKLYSRAFEECPSKT